MPQQPFNQASSKPMKSFKKAAQWERDAFLRAIAAGALAKIKGFCAEYSDAATFAFMDDTVKYTQTALHFAAEAGRVAVCNLLIEAGADVNALNERDDAPVHSAALFGRERVALHFIAKGAVPDARLLMYASYHGLPDVIGRTLDAGVGVNVREKHGRTALMNATMGGYNGRRLPAIETLLERGADPLLTDDCGKTAADWLCLKDKAINARVRGAESRGIIETNLTAKQAVAVARPLKFRPRA